MAFAPSDVLDRLAGLTAHPVRARRVDFSLADASVIGRFVDESGRWVGVVWADVDAVLRFSAAAMMLPMAAARHSLRYDSYLLDDFAELLAGCATAFATDGVRLAEVSDDVQAPRQVCNGFAFEVSIPGYGSGRIGFGMVAPGAGFDRENAEETLRRRETAPAGEGQDSSPSSSATISRFRARSSAS